MPIRAGAEIRQMEQREFKARAYDVMRHVFAVQKELGRLLHESIYQRAVASRVGEACCEVPVHVRFQDFCKTYYLDLLVAGGVLFELKAVESLAERHQRQLLQYLFLTDLPHGKLVNVRPERVKHEFVNNTLTRADRTSFDVDSGGFQETGTRRFRELMIAVLRDWGTGLNLGLYEEVAAHLCGQSPDAETKVGIRLDGHSLGEQRIRIAAPAVALRITALPGERGAEYQDHLSRLLDHTKLKAVQWINVTRALVEFKTIWKRK